MLQSLRPYGPQPARLLCAWDSPGKNAGVGCHAFPQGIFPTQGSNQPVLCLLYWQEGCLPQAPCGRPLHLCNAQNSCSDTENYPMTDFPGGLVAKTPSPKAGGSGFQPWLLHYIPHATVKSVHAPRKTEDLACCT